MRQLINETKLKEMLEIVNCEAGLIAFRTVKVVKRLPLTCIRKRASFIVDTYSILHGAESFLRS